MTCWKVNRCSNGRELGWSGDGSVSYALVPDSALETMSIVQHTLFLCLLSARLVLCYPCQLNLEPIPSFDLLDRKDFDSMWHARNTTSCYFLMEYHRRYRQAYIPVLDGTHTIFEPLGHVRVRSSEQDIVSPLITCAKQVTLPRGIFLSSVFELSDIAISWPKKVEHYNDFVLFNISQWEYLSIVPASNNILCLQLVSIRVEKLREEKRDTLLDILS